MSSSDLVERIAWAAPFLKEVRFEIAEASTVALAVV